MSKVTRSARGEAVDFDLLAIKNQLAATPTPVNVNARRNFIDERDGIRVRENTIYTPQLLTAAETQAMSQKVLKQDDTADRFVPHDVDGDPLAIATESVKASAKSKIKSE